MAIAFRSATKAAIASQSTRTLILPTGHALNDWIVVLARAGSGATLSMPDPWEEILTQGSSVSSMFWAWDDGSMSNPLLSMGASVNGAVVMAAFSGVDLVTPFSPGAGAVSFNGTAANTALIPGFSNSGHSFLLEGCTGGNNATATVSSGWSGDANASQSTTGFACLGWKSDSSADPAAVTMGLSGSFTSVGRQLALNAAGFSASDSARSSAQMIG